MIKKGLLFFIMFLVLISFLSAEHSDTWTSLESLEGRWQAKNEDSTITQEFKFILNKKILSMTTKAVFEPSEKRPGSEVHEDLGVFIFDTQ
jgi:hypothetical protein